MCCNPVTKVKEWWGGPINPLTLSFRDKAMQRAFVNH